MPLAPKLLRRSAPPLARQINRAPSPVIAYAAPWVMIMLCSMLPCWLVITQAPVMPPVGLMALLAWRQLRPGLLPVWSGFPLGLVDDCFSGAPFGAGMVLWSCALVVSDILEARFPWRSFFSDWLLASAFLIIAILASLLLAARTGASANLVLVAPQMLAAVAAYPLVGRLVGWVDRWRLTRFRVLD